MNLKLKYEFNDEVYAVYKEEFEDTVNIGKGKVVEFAMSKEHGLIYFLDDYSEGFKEEDLIPVARHDLLAARIDELLILKEEK